MKKPELNKEKAKNILKPSARKQALARGAQKTSETLMTTAPSPSSFIAKRFAQGAPLLGVLVLLATLFLALALISYYPEDPSFTYAAPTKEARNWVGIFGAWTADIAYFTFGWSALWWVAFGTSIGLRIPNWWGENGFWSRLKHGIGLVLLLVGSTALEALRFHTWGKGLPGEPGGILGQILLVDSVPYLGALGVTILAVFFVLLGLQCFFDFSWLGIAEKMGSRVDRRYQAVENIRQEQKDLKAGKNARKEREEQLKKEEAAGEQFKPPINDEPMPSFSISEPETVKPSQTEVENNQGNLFGDSLADRHDVRPSLTLLDPTTQVGPSIDKQSLAIMSGMIESKLRTYGVHVKVKAVHPGPVVTRYEIELDEGMKANTVKNLESDLARVLSVQSVRILDTVPGTTYMGIEAPNPKRQIVKIRELLGSQDFAKSRANLPICLGKRITGAPFVVDLAKMPHLLVAGTTGSGKSVGVNSMIMSLLYKFDPSKLRLIMIDPKSVEFAYYEDIPHLLCPVVTDMREASHGLQWCVKEMDRRYKLAQMLKTRSIPTFNERVRELRAQGKTKISDVVKNPNFDAPLQEQPSIVVIVDELADLLMVDKRGVEESLIRLAQKARAASIHLILATQRPSADVISGLLRTNIPSRAAFQVATASDSRIILDMSGAENLLGNGDFLFKTPGQQSLERVQGAFVTDEELERVTSALRQMAEPEYIDEILTLDEEDDVDLSGGTEGGKSDGRQSGKLDPLFDRAVQTILESNKCSVTYLQRRLGIGYPRAANLVDELEREGIVSAADNSGRRQILARREEGE